MERLTKTTEIGNAYFPKCFEEPCCGMGKCIDNNCNLVNEVCKKLAYSTIERTVKNYQHSLRKMFGAED